MMMDGGAGDGQDRWSGTKCQQSRLSGGSEGGAKSPQTSHGSDGGQEESTGQGETGGQHEEDGRTGRMARGRCRAAAPAGSGSVGGDEGVMRESQRSLSHLRAENVAEHGGTALALG